MATVVSFQDYTPVERFDAIPWTTVSIEESDEVDGDYTVIDTIALVPDPDPANPAPRDFTTILGTGEDLWYRVRFYDANGDHSEYTDPIQNVSEDLEATPYAGTAELARVLKLRAPTVDQLAAMERVLETAAYEIDAEIGRTGAFGTPYPPMVVQVNLERAVEHWSQQESAFGIIGLGGAEGQARPQARPFEGQLGHRLRWGPRTSSTRSPTRSRRNSRTASAPPTRSSTSCRCISG
jgi:hypothetical protein